MLVPLLASLFSLEIALSETKHKCPDNYRPGNGDGRCYNISYLPAGFEFAVPYDQQINICHDNGGDLVSITTVQEQFSLQWFRDIDQIKFETVFYIGLECENDHWKWTDNRTYNPFAANFADPEATNYCGRMEWTSLTSTFTSYKLFSLLFMCTLGIVFASIIGVIIVAAALIAIYICWRRRKNRQMNKVIQELTAKANYYDQEKAHNVENIRKADWEIDRLFVTVDWTNRLGNGAFGTVFLGHLSTDNLPAMAIESSIAVAALERNNGRVAVKMLSDSSNNADIAFRVEIDLMKNLGFHERLGETDYQTAVNMLACVTESSPTLLIVEFCAKGDLLGHMRKCREYMMSINSHSSLDYQQIITEKQQYIFAVQIACGLEYLSTRGYVHRDIAARNVLVDQNDAAKIGDFGLCRKLENEDGLYLTRGGRLPLKWMAPEALRNFEMSTASDVWAYGVFLFEIVTLGGSPYAGWTHSEVLPRLEAGERMARPDCCPETTDELMTACWMQRPCDRPSFTMIRCHLEDTLERMNCDTNYLLLDSQQEYYHIEPEHDQNVPENVIFSHIRTNQIVRRDHLSLFDGPLPLSVEQLKTTSAETPDGYQLPTSSPLKSPNPFMSPNQKARDDNGYQVPRPSPR
ncbi:hypothetical protein PRIPAC_84118 [Pristionchus pacificus]|uniref:Protein kinase domain-containing protein n=1 Tax=Pristionchus pacificus TaxID=54126 RepID=A0A2A6BV76_PRIPA|nr:hypothetical protein PRIPAC_84118 [Pristionchus pacificus]|eukprot:PDM69693.1 protein kinase [Pristionchus pacificus]